jgi:hypothetical protein
VARVLTVAAGGDCIGPVADRPLFISSCTRREMARRRPHRSAVRIQALALLLIAAALGAFIAARGGL